MEKEFMLRAIELAKLGRGFTNPNPLVGAVIVRDEKIIAEGYHHKIGDLHAERDAIKNAKENNVDLKNSTIYVTLEPCCHHGKQPPCVEAIVESGIKKVVIGSRDPNPLVNGGGVNFLKKNGIEVVQDFLKDECDELNPVFFHFIKTKMPYVIVKYAMTMDGQTATSIGESKWITSANARKNVHKTRSECMAIMTGIGTVLKDNPMLNVREIENARQPIRIILDSHLKISIESNIVKTANDKNCGKVIIFCSKNLTKEEKDKKSVLEEIDIQIEQIESADEQYLSLEKILKYLGEMGIDSVFVESGGKLNANLFFEGKNSKLVQEVQVYIAPKIFGNDGKTILSPVRGNGIEFPSDCINYGKPKVEFFDNDILLTYR